MAETTRACCFTGHRPENMGLATMDENAQEYLLLKDVIRREIQAKIDMGVCAFLTGCARGADIICGEIVLEMKKSFPDVKLVCVLPFYGQEANWSQRWKDRHANLLAHANAVVYVCANYSKAAFLERDRYMVEHSTDMIAISTGSDTGGTAYTIKQALKKQLSCVIIHPGTRNIVRKNELQAEQMQLEFPENN